MRYVFYFKDARGRWSYDHKFGVVSLIILYLEEKLQGLRVNTCNEELKEFESYIENFWLHYVFVLQLGQVLYYNLETQNVNS